MTIERPMFPPRAESVDSFSHQPAIGQPESGKLTSESRKPPEGFQPVTDGQGRLWFKADIAPSPTEGLDLALLRFVQCLVGYGLSLDDAGAVVDVELDRLRSGTAKKPRRSLIGTRWVPMPA